MACYLSEGKDNTGGILQRMGVSGRDVWRNVFFGALGGVWMPSKPVCCSLRIHADVDEAGRPRLLGMDANTMPAIARPRAAPCMADSCSLRNSTP